MSINGIATRVARLERATGRADECPDHDVAIVVRSVEGEATTGSLQQEGRACRRCGQPASAFWIELTIVPDRQRGELC